jgi:hypothetical protein
MADKDIYSRWKSGIASESKKQSTTPIFKIDEGTSNIVILPLPGTDLDDLPFVVSYTHKFRDGDETSFFTCNQQTSLYDTPCVACKARKILLGTEDEDDAQDAETLRPYPRGWFLCGNADMLKAPAHAIGFGLRTIDDEIGRLVNRYWKRHSKGFWDPDDCQVLTFERVGTGPRDTRYFGFGLTEEFGVGLEQIFKSAEQAKKLLDSRFPLSRIMPRANQSEVLEAVLNTTQWDVKRLGKLTIDDDGGKGKKRKSDDDEDERPSRKSSRDEEPPRKKRDDDDEPPRKKRDDDDDEPPRKKRDDDDEPPRKKKEEEEPPRKKRDDDDEPPRKKRDDDDEPPRKKRDDDDEPPRKKKEDEEPPRKKRDDDDEKPARRSRDDDDEPPARRKSRDEDEDEKPARRKSHDDDEPPRKKKGDDEDTKPSLKAGGKSEASDEDVDALIEKRRKERAARRSTED